MKITDGLILVLSLLFGGYTACKMEAMNAQIAAARAMAAARRNFLQVDVDQELTAQQQALQRGEDAMRRQLNQNNEAQIQIHRQFNLNGANDPVNSLSAEDREIFNGPRPEYSDADMAADAEYEQYICPISHTVPEVEDIVRWNGGYYSVTELNSYREHAESTIHPVTRQRLSHTQFYNSDTYLSLEEEDTVTRLVTEYQSRTPRREARQHYDRIVRQIENLRGVQRRQQQARNEGREVGASLNVEEEVRRRIEEEPEAVVMLGAAPAPVQRNRTNRNRGGQRGNRQADGNQEGNPLLESAMALRMLPTNPHGDPEIENAYNALLVRIRIGGYENFYRNRVAWFNNHSAELFAEGGPMRG